MKISIALATYNGEAYLSQQLESYLSQTRPPDELVVSDDCSTDRTREILSEFSRQAPFPVRVLSQPENVGFSRNFERAIRQCAGDIIFLSDQDDVWLPEKIERLQQEFIRDPQIKLVACDVEFCDKDLRTSGVSKITRFAALGIPPEHYVVGCASAFHASLLDLYVPLPERWTYDHWLHTLGHELGCRKLVHETLQLYRRHGGNAMDTYFNDPSVASRPVVKTTMRQKYQACSANAVKYGAFAWRIFRSYGYCTKNLDSGRVRWICSVVRYTVKTLRSLCGAGLFWLVMMMCPKDAVC